MSIQRITCSKSLRLCGLAVFLFLTSLFGLRAVADEAEKLIGHWRSESGKSYCIDVDGSQVTLSMPMKSDGMAFSGTYERRNNNGAIGFVRLQGRMQLEFKENSASTSHNRVRLLDGMSDFFSGVPRPVQRELLVVDGYRPQKEIEVLNQDKLILTHIIDEVKWQGESSPRKTQLNTRVDEYRETLTKVTDYEIDKVRITSEFEPFPSTDQLLVGRPFYVEVAFLETPPIETIWVALTTSSDGPIRVPVKRQQRSGRQGSSGSSNYRSEKIWLGKRGALPFEAISQPTLDAKPGDVVTASFDDRFAAATVDTPQIHISIRSKPSGPILKRVLQGDFFYTELKVPRTSGEHPESLWVNIQSKDTDWSEAVRLTNSGATGVFVVYRSEKMSLYGGPLPHTLWPFTVPHHGRWSEWNEIVFGVRRLGEFEYDNPDFERQNFRKAFQIRVLFEFDDAETEIMAFARPHAAMAANAREGLMRARQMYLDDLAALQELERRAANEPWLLENQLAESATITPESVTDSRRALQDKIGIIDNALQLLDDPKWDDVAEGDATRLSIAVKFAELLIQDPAKLGLEQRTDGPLGLSLGKAEQRAYAAAQMQGQTLLSQSYADALALVLRTGMETVASAGYAQLYALFNGTDIYGDPLKWYERLRAGAELFVSGFAISRLSQLRRNMATRVGTGGSDIAMKRIQPIRASTFPGSRSIAHPVILRQLQRSGFSPKIANQLAKLPPRELQRVLKMDGRRFNAFLDRSFRNYDSVRLSPGELALRKGEYTSGWLDPDRFTRVLSENTFQKPTGLRGNADVLAAKGLSTEEAIVRAGFSRGMGPKAMMQETSMTPPQLRRVLDDVMIDEGIPHAGKRSALIDEYMSGRMSANPPTRHFDSPPLRPGDVASSPFAARPPPVTDGDVAPRAPSNRPNVPRHDGNTDATPLPNRRGNAANELEPGASSNPPGQSANSTDPLSDTRVNPAIPRRFDDLKTERITRRTQRLPRDPFFSARATEQIGRRTTRLSSDPRLAGTQILPQSPPRFGPDDLVYGPTARGALRRFQEQGQGGRTLFDMERPMDGTTWTQFSRHVLNEAAESGRRVHFDLTNMRDIDDVLAGRGPFADKITAAELRHIRDNWERFDVKPRFYRNNLQVAPPWQRPSAGGFPGR